MAAVVVVFDFYCNNVSYLWYTSLPDTVFQVSSQFVFRFVGWRPSWILTILYIFGLQ